MRIVEDKYGNRFLEIENKEDFRKFKEDLLKRAKERLYKLGVKGAKNLTLQGGDG